MFIVITSETKWSKVILFPRTTVVGIASSRTPRNDKDVEWKNTLYAKTDLCHYERNEVWSEVILLPFSTAVGIASSHTPRNDGDVEWKNTLYAKTDLCHYERNEVERSNLINV